MNARLWPSGDTDGEDNDASLNGSEGATMTGDAAFAVAARGHQWITAAVTASTAAVIHATISRPRTGRVTCASVEARSALELVDSLTAWSANAKSRADWNRSFGSFSIA
jgi:hypothetical protein